MKIAVITSSFPAFPEDARAAAGLFVRDFCVELANLGHEITVITPDKTAESKQDPPNINVHWFPWSGGDRPLSVMKPHYPRDALAMLSLFRRGNETVDRLARGRAFDHVLAMWAVPCGVFARRLKRRFGIAYTTWCLGSDIWTYGRVPVLKNVVASVLRDSDYIYADGLALADATAKLANRPCPFLPSSRKLNRSAAPPARLDCDGLKILFVGRYHRVKGVDVLLEAMAKFLSMGERGHLWLFGGGPEEVAIRARAQMPDLHEHVTVGGFADEPTYVAHVQACDVVVIPSRMESIPVVLSDALQMGKPLIVSDVGDMGRLLRETPAGIVIPPEDATALANALTKMATADRTHYAEAVAQLARKFDIAETARRWLNDIAP